MSVVNLTVVSPETRSERRFDLHLTVGQLKSKLEPITGISSSSQKISLLNSEDDRTVLSILNDDTRPLGYYNVKDRQTLKIDDTDPSSSSKVGQFTDVSQVEKFEISKEEYEERRDTVLTYKKQHNMGRFAPESEQEKSQPNLEQVIKSIPIGSRCEVDIGDAGLKKRGSIRYVGNTKFGGGGIWVGIEYDEPLGKNDGSVQGERYFTCKPLYGSFVRPDKVVVGDFPEIDPFEEDEEI